MKMRMGKGWRTGWGARSRLADPTLSLSTALRSCPLLQQPQDATDGCKVDTGGNLGAGAAWPGHQPSQAPCAQTPPDVPWPHLQHLLVVQLGEDGAVDLARLQCHPVEDGHAELGLDRLLHLHCEVMGGNASQGGGGPTPTLG